MVNLAATGHPVAELIRARAASGSLPGRRDDAHRLALAIEGGAMRGVISAGMTAALEQLGLGAVFDAVYGSSAGAINGAYFISGRAALCASSYYEEMTTRGFIDWSRGLRRRPILSLDFVLEVAEGSKPLDWSAVLSSPIEFHAIAASVRTLTPVDLTGFEDKQQLKDALRASSQVPLLAGPPVQYGDDLLLDASLFASIPFKIAVEDGATHVLTLRTRPSGTLRTAPSLWERLVVAPQLRRVSPDLAKAFLRRAEQYREEVEELAAQSADPENEPYVLAIAPATVSVGQAERSKSRMLAGAKEGYEVVYEALTGRRPYVIDVLRAFDPVS